MLNRDGGAHSRTVGHNGRTMAIDPDALDHTFTAPIGVDVKGSMWACIEVPNSREVFGTGRSVRVDLTIDGVAISNLGLMPTGTGGLMISTTAKLRKQLGKDIGDDVTVHLERRLT